MKKLLSLWMVLLVGLASCNDDVKVRVSIEPDFKVTRHGVFELTASVVPDFDHVYDSISFLATNLGNNKQTSLTGKLPDFSFAGSPGNYNLYMGTKSARRIERYAHFSANVPSVAISSTTKNVTLTSETQQGLILITRTGVEGTPTVTCGGITKPMWSSTKYFYAYVYDDGKGAKLNVTISGVLFDNVVIGVTKGTVYVFNPLGIGVKATDAFPTLYNI